MTRCWPLVIVFAGLGCSPYDGGLDYARLGVSASNEAGLVTPVGCTTLPVLRGARVLTRYDIGDRFDVVVDATFERAEVRTEGLVAPDGFSRSLAPDTLRAGFAETIVVPTAGGSVTVTLTSECTP